MKKLNFPNSRLFLLKYVRIDDRNKTRSILVQIILENCSESLKITNKIKYVIITDYGISQ